MLRYSASNRKTAPFKEVFQAAPSRAFYIAPMASGTGAAKSMQERLMELQLKKNEARVRVKKATEEEVANEKLGPRALAKKEKADDEKKLEQFKAKLEEEGIDPERHHRLHQTQVRLALCPLCPALVLDPISLCQTHPGHSFSINFIINIFGIIGGPGGARVVLEAQRSRGQGRGRRWFVFFLCSISPFHGIHSISV